MVGVLLKNEWIKTTRRFAFWVTVLSLTLITVITTFGQYRRRASHPDLTPYTLPGAWSDLGDMVPVVAFASAILMILLVANEFTWKTARQNVIDGLSKGQLYLAKVLVLPLVSLVVFCLLVAAPLLVGWYGAHVNEVSGPLVRGYHLALVGGSFLGVLLWATLALSIALLVRSSGAAMGLFFFWAALLERLLEGALNRLGGTYATVADYLPADLGIRLGSLANYSLEHRQAAVQRAMERSIRPPEFLPVEWMLGAAAGYVVVLLLVSYFIFIRRDL